MSDKDEATRLADAPQRIWLQVCDDADCVEPFGAHDGVTWCQDKIHDTDIEYVRAERIAQMHSAYANSQQQFVEAAERIAALEAALEQARVALEQARVALEVCKGWVDIYGQPESQQQMNAELRAIEETQR